MSATKEIGIAPAPHATAAELGEGILDVKREDDFEVFKTTIDGVQFRDVGWPMASVIFIKST